MSSTKAGVMRRCEMARTFNEGEEPLSERTRGSKWSALFRYALPYVRYVAQPKGYDPQFRPSLHFALHLYRGELGRWVYLGQVRILPRRVRFRKQKESDHDGLEKVLEEPK